MRNCDLAMQLIGLPESDSRSQIQLDTHLWTDGVEMMGRIVLREAMGSLDSRHGAVSSPFVPVDCGSERSKLCGSPDIK